MPQGMELLMQIVLRDINRRLEVASEMLKRS